MTSKTPTRVNSKFNRLTHTIDEFESLSESDRAEHREAYMSRIAHEVRDMKPDVEKLKTQDSLRKKITKIFWRCVKLDLIRRTLNVVDDETQELDGSLADPLTDDVTSFPWEDLVDI